MQGERHQLVRRRVQVEVRVGQPVADDAVATRSPTYAVNSSRTWAGAARVRLSLEAKW
ncbi:hypothetical protein AB0I46_38000 [Streptomyces spectabilis]|uniref:hypothetical protein n=1 Tax=Streptomyces spectabilis TaxID=68270 RepID=UPI0033C83E9C